MISEEVKKSISSLGFQGEVRISEELKKHTSLAIGGPADIFIVPSSQEELMKTFGRLREEGFRYRILGRGSNLLISDEGVRGAVVKIGPPLDNFRFGKNRLLAESGAGLAALAQKAAEKGLSGLEFGIGIPGTVGGAVVMNAGGQGQEISGVIRKVQVFHPRTGIKNYSRQECRFVYRGSRFRGGDEFILEVEFELEPDSISAVKERIKKNLAIRKRNFPLRYPSAGSVFKNPPGEHAGRLIEGAGLKGKRIGGAQISEKHANFIVNRGQARAEEVLQLIEITKVVVKDKFDIDLELEIEIWGWEQD